MFRYFKFHYFIYDANVLYLVLGHKFFLMFASHMYIAFVLSCVLGSRLHFHTKVLAYLMFYILLFYYFS